MRDIIDLVIEARDSARSFAKGGHLPPTLWRITVIEERGSQVIFASETLRRYEYTKIGNGTWQLDVYLANGTMRTFYMGGTRRFYIAPNEGLGNFTQWVHRMQDK